VLLSGIGVTAPAAAAPGIMISVPQTLARMVEASRTLSYRGVAVYEQDGTARTVSVVHAVRGGRKLERLEYLDGPRSELVRMGEPDDCNPVADRLLQGDAVTGGGVPVRLSDHYRATFRNDDRIAGRMVRQIYMEPRDSYRYGHLLGVDAASGLLLQDLVLDARGESSNAPGSPPSKSACSSTKLPARPS
jgi:sigma-E factor negative regulatory protein RseB